MNVFDRYAPFIQHYVYRSGWRALRALRRDASLGLLRPGSVYLFCVWNDRLRPYRGLHTFAGAYDPQPGFAPWVIFNRFNQDRSSRRYADVTDVLKNGKTRGAYLVIYEVRKLAEQKQI